ncbi:MAG TPA: ABC transporter permease [Candidatus Limnocylindrales bacterium]|nr:ABC transporter permease [Candidatus Limnocylindrales bacterium]
MRGSRPGLRSGSRSGSRSGPLGVAILVLVFVVAVLAPWLAPYDPTVQELRDRLLPPWFVPGGSVEHLLGTDGNGRDLLSRILVGSRLSLLIGGATVLIGGTIGVAAGIVAGLRGGWFDLFAGRLADVQQAIPFIILALAVVGVLGSSVENLIAVLGIGSWFYWYRVVRGEVLALRERPFVEAARAVGVGDWQLVRRQLWRNLAPSIIVLATLWLPQAIAYTAGLSFLGLGVPPPTPEWGRLIADGTEQIADAWWLAALPSLALLVTVLGLTLTGDWLRDLADPIRRGRQRG